MNIILWLLFSFSCLAPRTCTRTHVFRFSQRLNICFIIIICTCSLYLLLIHLLTIIISISISIITHVYFQFFPHLISSYQIWELSLMLYISIVSLMSSSSAAASIFALCSNLTVCCLQHSSFISSPTSSSSSSASASASASSGVRAKVHRRIGMNEWAS